jgi:multidrug efflux pump
MKTGLVPNEDQGTIFIFSFLPSGASASRTDEFTNELNNIINKDPNIKDLITLAGYDLTTSSQRTHAAATVVKLKPWDDRPNPDQYADAILKRLSSQVMRTSEGFSMGVLPPPIMGMSVTGGFDMYIQDRTGGTIKDLDNIAKQIIQKASQRKELMAVRTSLNTAIPQYKLDVDVQKAKAKGVNVADIYNTVNATFGSYYVNDFSLYGRTYKVNLQADSEYRKSTDDLKSIFVKSSKGELLPISSFAKMEKNCRCRLN